MVLSFFHHGPGFLLSDLFEERRFVFAILYRSAGLRYCHLHRHHPGRSGGRLHVAGGSISRSHAAYRSGLAPIPGANAQTVRDTVAAPIEEQVSGVEGMMFMSSRCTNDGAYNLVVTFKLGMDSDMAQVLVQNRVSLALPVIPALVQNEGLNVKKMSPSTLMIVNLVSPNSHYDSIFLSNYATIYVKDELGRLPGVAGITYLGQRDYSLRAWLDPDKLATLNLSAMDVVTAISQQNIQVAAGQIGQQPVPRGQQFQLTINTVGRLSDPEQFADIIIKAGSGTTATHFHSSHAAGSRNNNGQLH